MNGFDIYIYLQACVADRVVGVHLDERGLELVAIPETPLCEF